VITKPMPNGLRQYPATADDLASLCDDRIATFRRDAKFAPYVVTTTATAEAAPQAATPEDAEDEGLLGA
jgi:hypothetical protein